MVAGLYIEIIINYSFIHSLLDNRFKLSGTKELKDIYLLFTHKTFMVAGLYIKIIINYSFIHRLLENRFKLSWTKLLCSQKCSLVYIFVFMFIRNSESILNYIFKDLAF